MQQHQQQQQQQQQRRGSVNNNNSIVKTPSRDTRAFTFEETGVKNQPLQNVDSGSVAQSAANVPQLSSSAGINTGKSLFNLVQVPGLFIARQFIPGCFITTPMVITIF